MRFGNQGDDFVAFAAPGHRGRGGGEGGEGD
jgi:hypothetical protein